MILTACTTICVKRLASRWLLVWLCLWTVVGIAQPASARTDALPTITLTIGEHRIAAEVATTPEQRSTGLMNRFSLRPDTGMIFVFPRAEPQGFWMKNTYVPLSIAFIDGEGRIVNIEDMTPLTETTHWSRGPAQFALEMRKGWFREHGVGAGERVGGLPKSSGQ
ncbi:MAG: DUF192 domain-containing protein [Casimicrobiaceae bacterium]